MECPGRLHHHFSAENQTQNATHLIIVALGKEQSTEFTVERGFVCLLAVLCQFVHVRLSQLESLFSQVIFTVTIPNMQQPWEQVQR